MTFKWNSFLATIENNGNWVFVKKSLTKLEWTRITKKLEVWDSRESKIASIQDNDRGSFPSGYKLWQVITLELRSFLSLRCYWWEERKSLMAREIFWIFFQKVESSGSETVTIYHIFCCLTSRLDYGSKSSGWVDIIFKCLTLSLPIVSTTA